MNSKYVKDFSVNRFDPSGFPKYELWYHCISIVVVAESETITRGFLPGRLS